MEFVSDLCELQTGGQAPLAPTINGMATNIDPDKLMACPTCAAAVQEDFIEEHMKWHAEQHSDTGQTGPTGDQPNIGE